MIKIAPSILSADFARLEDEIKKVERAGADMLHVDVMDGHFVPNITIGAPVVKCIRRVTQLPLDVHLMIEYPDDFIDSFADEGADILTVHVETCRHLNRTVQKIKDRGVKPAVALNPATSLSALDWILDEVDMVLLMTVNPGFGGQSYIKPMTEKIRRLKRMIDDRGANVEIQIDGGVDLSNISEAVKAGATIIVAGSTIYNAEDTEGIIKSMREKACR